MRSIKRKMGLRKDRKKKEEGKTILLKSKEKNSVEKLNCITTLTEEDVNEALKQPYLRVNGVLYDSPILQLQKILQKKQFGPVNLKLIKAKDQTPPSRPGSINVKADDREDLIKFLKKHKPSINEEGSPLLKLKREDCGCEFVFQEEKDIPHESVTCEHQNRIILYENENQEK